MNWRDIDFGAVSRMMDALSDDEKENIMNMAQNMMNGFNPNGGAGGEEGEPAPEAEEEIEVETDFLEGLRLNPVVYGNLDPAIMKDLESGYDLEVFYEDDEEADLSGSVLFYSKALLKALRRYLYPVLTEAGLEGSLPSAAAMDLQGFLQILYSPENRKKAAKRAGLDEEDFEAVFQGLSQTAIQFSRAISDSISRADLDYLKSLLLGSDLIAELASIR